MKQPNPISALVSLLARVCISVGLMAGAGAAHAERLKDLASIQGVRGNQLIGYGLVVGLDGSGDQVRQTPFTQQSLTNMLSQLGITVPPGSNMQLKNVAAVMVTTTLPAFARPGQTLDVVVSSMGNAKSLRGGTLLMTPLKGADSQVYAIAQGNILVGGAGASAGGSSVQINQLNGGRISAGAIVERGVPTTFARDGYVYVELNNTDFGTAQNVAMALNRKFGQGTATALDGRVVQVRTPMDQASQARFLSQLEDLQVARAPTVAKVIINARTGSVVMNRTVMIEEAAVAHGNLSVIINRQNQVSQPDTPFTEGQTVVVPNTQIEVRQENGSLQRVSTSANLADVVKGLNALGATPQDLLAILQAMKTAGALRAELEII
ncbi:MULTISPECIES: flagellar basal body P-ring protein FlgI [Achromobacter]|jgi:flagellar P-ring protein precursor FlgI|uniref:Flagellar P-ring protein n=1 Tax=Achromobacter aegrifaciens TaxID=1287736 RepID=A0ABU2DGI6_ACHAE|nr:MULTISPECIES: flagellar basal body P-ring protein FlgI [Achromobacter]MBD9379787.1 flagellar basal body P-ring protein FlgI [Achromobacter sp. ACM02]MBD9428558.1 flagellar basal body P-ring protein FlgI [Achromobacter sp. ACM03]MDQ1763316.1 flagellar basal body P-ring protein FlgI [Achromobacter aegrifaciens]MDR7947226.1 flagellar basal body P-ring protein FlgI [Achromobacter aegrifaciens]RII99474.1 flagellar basal body P-ring protein FlgI [Achromobacter sp. K91]